MKDYTFNEVMSIIDGIVRSGGGPWPAKDWLLRNTNPGYRTS